METVLLFLGFIIGALLLFLTVMFSGINAGTRGDPGEAIREWAERSAPPQKPPLNRRPWKDVDGEYIDITPSPDHR